MSERRSTEIKFRTTPSFKARVQAAAAAAGKSMSEFLEECAETRMWADSNIEALSPNARSLQEYISTNVGGSSAGQKFREGLAWANGVLGDPGAAAVAASGMSEGDLAEIAAAFTATPQPDAVSTSGEEGAKKELPALTEAQEHQFEVLLQPFEPSAEPKGWMFEARQ